MGQMTDTQFGALAAAQEDVRSMQIFLTGYLSGVCAQHLAEPVGPLRAPVEVETVSDEHSQYLPRFLVRLASGIQLQVRVDPATVAADLVDTWRDGLHSPSRSICPGCGAELARVGLTALAYTFEACTCGSPDYDHLVEQLWHRSCLRAGAAADG
jgi:hypothetical protein